MSILKKYYQIGQEVRVMVTNVDLYKKDIDFYLEERDETFSQ